MLAVLLAPTLAIAADDPSVAIADAEASAHRVLCHRDAAWHCFTPPEGQVLLDVTMALDIGWATDIKSYRTKDQIAVLVSGARHTPIASGAGGLLFELEPGTLYRPYDWEKGSEPKPLELIFAIPADARDVRLTVGPAWRDLVVPEPATEPPDQRRVAAFDVQFSKWHGPVWSGETKLGDQRLTDTIDLGCEVLEVGLSARALEGLKRQFSSSEKVSLETKFFGLRAPELGYLRPLEERWDKALPVADVQHNVEEGKQVDVSLLFCVGDRIPTAELLFRGMPIAVLSLEEGTTAAPPDTTAEESWVDTIKGWLGM